MPAAPNPTPSTMTITYVNNYGVSPWTTAQVTITFPSTGASAMPDYALAVKNLVLAGGLWVTLAGVLTWIPYDSITLITVQ